MRKSIMVILISILVPLFLFIGGYWFVSTLFNDDDQAFNRTKWLNDRDERIYMVRDLLENYLLHALSKSEVIQLLGKPLGDSRSNSNQLVYYLGDERGFISIDSEWLHITFDHQNKVTNYEIQTD